LQSRGSCGPSVSCASVRSDAAARASGGGVCRGSARREPDAGWRPPQKRWRNGGAPRAPAALGAAQRPRLCGAPRRRRRPCRGGIDGLPAPARVACGPNQRPQGLPRRLRGAVQGAQHRGVPRFPHGGFLLECTPPRGGTARQRPRCIAPPPGVKTHVEHGGLHCRHAPAVGRGAPDTPLGTAGGLTEGARSAAGRCATVDDLGTRTVQAADREERPGPCLPQGGYEDEAQCDSHRSPSPLLKHY